MQGIQISPRFSILHASLVASYAYLDRMDAARKAAERLQEIAPDRTVGTFMRMDVVRPPLMERLGAALLKAGLPE